MSTKGNFNRRGKDCEYDYWVVRECKLTRQTVEQLTLLLASLSSSYRVLVGAADELSRISLARRSHVEDAVHRAVRLGKVIDDVVKRLDQRIHGYIDVLGCCDGDVSLTRPGISQPPRPFQGATLPRGEDSP